MALEQIVYLYIHVYTKIKLIFKCDKTLTNFVSLLKILKTIQQSFCIPLQRRFNLSFQYPQQYDWIQVKLPFCSTHK